jgi:hypothetical protein
VSSPPTHFCTYFDHRYLPRGLALYQSLQRHCQSFRLWVLCLDEACFVALNLLQLPDVQLIRLEDFEARDHALFETRTNRTLVEYYFTCTPSLALHVLDLDAGVQCITYIDSDLFFFSDPSPIYEEMGDRSVAIIGHRFPPQLQHLDIHGAYNVGLLVFKRDANGFECLRWWRERCIQWCYDRVENGLFADQGYLNDWPTRFNRVAVLEHKGANMAPWNLQNYSLHFENLKVLVDDVPLICFHFQGLKRRNLFLYDLGLQSYGVCPSNVLLNRVFAPYVSTLESTTNLIRASAYRQSTPSETASGRPSLANFSPLAREGNLHRFAWNRKNLRETASGIARRQLALYIKERLI